MVAPEATAAASTYVTTAAYAGAGALLAGATTLWAKVSGDGSPPPNTPAPAPAPGSQPPAGPPPLVPPGAVPLAAGAAAAAANSPGGREIIQEGSEVAGETGSAAVEVIESAAQMGAGSAGQVARQASTAFGKAVEGVRQSLSGGGGPWSRLTAHAESATSESKRLQGATSIEEVFVQSETGQRVIRHTIVRGGEVLHETFRPYAKFGAE